ncbi:MAG: NB-ARC domain-containing protein [Actinomycetota bacterium]|nr:NB-ARC domain-containing protein [Actinomycetota bacterium]
MIIPVGMAGGMLWCMVAPRRVFLSHTSEVRQLPAGRSVVDAAESAVMRADGLPVDMARFCADPRPPAEVCQEAVLGADVFVGFVGFRYGLPVRGRPELSYTELEFETAIQAGKPVLVFLLDDENVLRVGGRSARLDARQRAFRRRLSDSGVTTRTVSTPDQLELAVYQALVKLDRFRGPVAAVPPLRGDEVERPGLMAQLVEAVIHPEASAVGMTTGLWGAGGFGKTTMARLLAHRDEVRQQFPDGVVWVTIGEDTTGPELAEKLTNAVGLLGGDRPPLTDPLTAGAELARALGQRRVLLVVDDVWTSAQVEPFLIGAPASVRLFTTRIRGVLPSSAQQVVVDEMNHREAQQLLIAGTAGPSGDVVKGLLAATGRWPVLLGLVNRAVRADLDAGRRAEESMREILHELQTTGPTALDVTDAAERHTAVARTIEVSLSRLTAQQRARYLELAVFGQDVVIPVPVLARYFKATAGWSSFQTRQYCLRLAELALVSDYRSDEVGLHDVIHDYLREQTMDRSRALHRTLIDAHRGLVPDEGEMNAWWQLPPEETYLWNWLPTHLHNAGLEHQLQACLHHPKWLVGKLEQVGPAGLEADLALSDAPLSRALGTAVRQNAHLLGPLHPPGSLAATLATRLFGDGPTTVIADQVIAGLTGPHLRAIAPLPDLPHPALLRVQPEEREDVAFVPWITLMTVPNGTRLLLFGTGDEIRVWDAATGTVRHTLTSPGAVSAVAVAPDGAWLASADGDGVRIWDLTIGSVRRILTPHTRWASALVVAPDGSWLASASGTRIRVWDTVTGALRHTLTGHTRKISALVVAPDGSWLASADAGGKVRVWDPVTGTARHAFTGHNRIVEALAVAPDGSWLASADQNVRIWEPVAGTARHVLTGHTSWVWVLVVAPDGSWLASAGDDGQVRVWDPATGANRHILTGHIGAVRALAVTWDGSRLASADERGEVRTWNPTAATHHSLTGYDEMVETLAVTPDGCWLASGSFSDGKVRIWDLVTGTLRRTMTGHIGPVVELVVAPDGSWLASADDEGELRIWDSATGTARHVRTGPAWEVQELVVAPDGSWLAYATPDREVRILDPATGVIRHTLTGHIGEVQALVVAPDGSWLASAGSDGEVRIWDPATGTIRYTMTSDASGLGRLVVAPDGSWLASSSGSSQTDTDGEVQIWDLAIGTIRHTMTGHASALGALLVAPDGSWLASADRDPFTGLAYGRPHLERLEVQIWDPTTGTARHTLTGHTDTVWALAAAPDGSWLASASRDGEVRIWDPTTGAHPTSLRVASGVSHLVVTPTTIAAAGSRGVYFLNLCRGSQPGQAP